MRWKSLCGGLALLLATAVAFSVLSPSRSPAQDKAAAPDEESFLTADGIQLHGLFHRSLKNPGSDPVVILLYPPGKDNSMLKGDWSGLANRLTKEGYNVFRFDWRGHGKSFDIKDSEYWRWHEAAEDLCREVAPELFAKRPKDIADREGYTDVECVYDMLKGYLNLANEYYCPLSESSARKRLAKEGLRLRKLCEDNYCIINTKGEVVAGDDFDMCWDQVARYTIGHRSGY